MEYKNNKSDIIIHYTEKLKYVQRDDEWEINNLTNSLLVEVEPDILKWAMEPIHDSEIVKRLNISLQDKEDWLAGRKNPTYAKIKELSSALMIPTAVFFLFEPPSYECVLPDLRTLPDSVGKFNFSTLKSFNDARYYRELAKEMILTLNKNPSSNIPISASISKDNPKVIAERYRKYFGIDISLQKGFKDERAALNYYRDLINKLNVFVFTMDFPITDARGFAIIEEEPKVIAISKYDIPQARIFSLFHEFAHIVLGKSGVSLVDNYLLNSIKNPIEVWCNKFASELLLPQNVIKSLFVDYFSEIDVPEYYGAISDISSSLKVSKRMIIEKLYSTKLISRYVYSHLVDLNNRPVYKEEKSKKEMSIPKYNMMVSKLGKNYFDLVKQIYNNKEIHKELLSEYTNMNENQLNKAGWYV